MSRFRKPASARWLKVLLHGPSDSGKTLAALTFPRVALVDSEGGWEWHLEKPGIEAPAVVQTKQLSDLTEAIRDVRADAGKTFDTLVVDTITVFYDRETARLRAEKGAKFGYSERAFVNERMKDVYNELTQLPVHVVVIARETDAYLVEGTQLKRNGIKADGDKSILYPFDFVIQMNGQYQGTVRKSRGALPKNHVLKQVTFETLFGAVTPGDLRNVNEATAFVKHWNEQGITNKDLLAALQVESLSQWVHGRAAADARVQAYVNRQVEGEHSQTEFGRSHSNGKSKG